MQRPLVGVVRNCRGCEGAKRRNAIVRLTNVLAGVPNGGLGNGVIELVADRGRAGALLEPLDALDGRKGVHEAGKCHRRALEDAQRIEQAQTDSGRVCFARIGSCLRVGSGVERKWFCLFVCSWGEREKSGQFESVWANNVRDCYICLGARRRSNNGSERRSMCHTNPRETTAPRVHHEEREEWRGEEKM